ncbi:hypothetical protein LBMAG46_41190 [Planctomycetia bacterium]|nr:hypothetical protein LBMAG46_41190 [Planctomycetia bacterium]
MGANRTFVAAGISRFEVTRKRKPFDFFVGRFDLKKSRNDNTAIEHFIAGIRDWDAAFRRGLKNGNSNGG